jgi:VWFA-related protein
MLGESLSDTDFADIVSLSGQTNSGLTRDHARLQNAIMGLKRHSGPKVESDECPRMDYYQAYMIANNSDYEATEEAVSQAMGCTTTRAQAEALVMQTAARVLAVGAQDVRLTYAVIADFVRRMADLPGQRTIILVSSGFISISQEALDEETQIMDLAAQSNVTISSLDARGLYTTSLTASDNLRGRSPRLLSDFRSSGLSLSENPMAELAHATGGTFFHNSNDLGAGFKKLTEVPETVYVLEIPLDNRKPDGNFHALKVTVGRPGMQVLARPGYFIPRPAKSKK